MLGKKLMGPGVGLTDVLAATEYVVPALEIVDARVQDPRKIFDTVADNGAAAGIVMGGRPVRPMDVDLRWVGGIMYVNSEIEETGVAAGVLGHPAMGVAWLANKLGTLGTPMEPGHIVLAGSFTRVVFAEEGRHAARRLRPARRHLGAVRVRTRSDGHAAQRLQARHRQGPIADRAVVQPVQPGRDRGGVAFRLRLAAARHRAFAERRARHPRRICRRRRPAPRRCVVRPAWNDMVLIKRYLDIGAQTLLLPFVQNAGGGQARGRVRRAIRRRACAASPASGRASRYGRVKDYLKNASSEICVLVQVETREALKQIEAIASVDGVDGVFIGPNDLSASFGHIGNWGHPEVQAAFEDAVQRLKKIGKPAGILTPNEEEAKKFIGWGYTFVAVGADLGLLAKNADALAKRFKPYRSDRAMAWQSVPRANFMFLHAARLQAHYAAQWLARAARAYVPAQPNDAPHQSRLGRRVRRARHASAAGRLAARLAHRRSDARLPRRASAGAAARWPRRRRGADLARRPCRGAQSRRRQARRSARPTPCRDHVLALGARYSLDELGDALQVLATWYSNANAALTGVQKHLAARKLKAPAVRCWPHHFDMDCAGRAAARPQHGHRLLPRRRILRRAVFLHLDVAGAVDPGAAAAAGDGALAHLQVPGGARARAQDRRRARPGRLRAAVPRCVGGGRAPRAEVAFSNRECRLQDIPSVARHAIFFSRLGTHCRSAGCGAR